MTLVFECAFCFMWGVYDKHNLLLILMLNIMTNPLAVGIYYRFGGGYCVKIPIELAVTAVEALYFSKFSKNIRLPALLAVLMNIFSFTLGEIINNA